MRLDLHIHTTASDGSWSAEQVVEGAMAGGLDVIAIADHDTTAAVTRARAASAHCSLHVIPALEVSSTYEDREIHVLGYFVDPESDPLVRHGARASGRREERMKEMIERLSAQGIEVSYRDVEQAAGPDRSSIGRPHLARALVAQGRVSNVPEAFARFIGDHCPAFVPTHLLDPAGAVQLIRESGGIPVWAHPPADMVDILLPELIREGLRGIEVYRPSHRHHDVLRLEKLCRTAGMLKTGGSDWHSPDAGSALGDFQVDGREVEAFLSAGGM